MTLKTKLKVFLFENSIFLHILLFRRGSDLRKVQTLQPLIRKSTKEREILIVGMVSSPHLHEWISATKQVGVFQRISLFPSDSPSLSDVERILFDEQFGDLKVDVFRLVKNSKLNRRLYLLFDQAFGDIWRSYFLFKVINKNNFDIVHFHELQHGAYLYNYINGHPKLKSNFVTISSTWGSDLSFFRNTVSNKGRLKDVMTWTRILTAEKVEEISQAKEINPNIRVLAPMYITIGDNRPRISDSVKPSLRKGIIVKGYQDAFGRALNSLECIRRLEEELKGFTIYVYVAADAVRLMVETLQSTTSLKIEIVPWIPKNELDNYFKRSRVFLGLSISDGLPSSLVEAIASGTFPIQSKNSAGSVLINDGINGFLVDPWDLESVTEAIRRAIREDKLVDSAQNTGREILETRFNYRNGLEKVKNLYLESLKEFY